LAPTTKTGGGERERERERESSQLIADAKLHPFPHYDKPFKFSKQSS